MWKGGMLTDAYLSTFDEFFFWAVALLGSKRIIKVSSVVTFNLFRINVSGYTPIGIHNKLSNVLCTVSKIRSNITEIARIRFRNV